MGDLHAFGVLAMTGWTLLASACASQTATVLAPGPDAPGSDTTSAVLFSDDFSRGYGANWLTTPSGDGVVADAVDGSNSVASFDSTYADFTRLRCNLGGDKFTASDLAASMRLRVEQAPVSDRTIRLDVRQASGTQNIFYAVGVTVSSDDGSVTKLGIFKKVDDGSNNYTICALAQTKLASPIPIGAWSKIKLAISGGSPDVHLVGFLDDAPMVTFDDDCASPLVATSGDTVANGGSLVGQTGLGIQVEKGIIASIDDILVTAL